MKFLIWAKDRFPFLNVTTAFVMAAAAKLAVEAGPLLTWTFRDLAAGLFILTHLFILRVFDEHKDFKSDQIYHPERALQKGLISLKEIKFYGWVAGFIQVVAYFLLDSQFALLPGWAFLWLWTFFMFKEFGLRHWLREHIFIYSFSHLLISPILFWLVMSVYNHQLWPITTPMILLLLLSLQTGFLYELTRKNKTTSEDEKGEMSFSSVYGRGLVGGFIGFIGLLTLMTGAQFLKHWEALSLTYVVGAIVIESLLLLSLLKFWKNPTTDGRKKNEGISIVDNEC